ncbi:MAG: ketoacyl-ACP synthase III, partial [Myxococcota bacterium]|nr:ketoacyl-ACP synthase III [Myxococcota bacterium]
MLRAVITGCGSYLPARQVSNAELAELCASSDEWIVERTGIRTRHFAAVGETASVMGAIAARRALDAAGRSAQDVDALLFASLSPDYLFPGCGCILQHELGLREIPCIDVRNQCAGFVLALSIADAFVRAGSYRSILVVASELQSTGLRFDEEGRELAVLFGDGAGAVLLEAVDEQAGRGLIACSLASDGQHARELFCEGPASSRF